MAVSSSGSRAVRPLAIAVIVARASVAAAQPSVHVAGGAAASFAFNASEPFALPSDGRAIVPTAGVGFASGRRRAALQVELDLPVTRTRRIPGAIKAGPVTYVIAHRDAIATVLAGVAVAGGGPWRVNAVGGFGLVRREWSVGYAGQPEIDAHRRTHLASCAGADLVVERSNVVVTLPRFRTCYVPGIETQLNGFSPSRLLVTGGASLGWRF